MIEAGHVFYHQTTSDRLPSIAALGLVGSAVHKQGTNFSYAGKCKNGVYLSGNEVAPFNWERVSYGHEYERVIMRISDIDPSLVRADPEVLHAWCENLAMIWDDPYWADHIIEHDRLLAQMCERETGLDIVALAKKDYGSSFYVKLMDKLPDELQAPLIERALWDESGGGVIYDGPIAPAQIEVYRDEQRDWIRFLDMDLTPRLSALDEPASQRVAEHDALDIAR